MITLQRVNSIAMSAPLGLPLGPILWRKRSRGWRGLSLGYTPRALLGLDSFGTPPYNEPKDTLPVNIIDNL
jgi:hypothetical protein